MTNKAIPLAILATSLASICAMAADNPAVTRGMVNDNAALRHYLFEIAQAQ